MRNLQKSVSEVLSDGNYCYILDSTTSSKVSSKFSGNGIAVIIREDVDKTIEELEKRFNVVWSSKQVGYHFLIIRNNEIGGENG